MAVYNSVAVPHFDMPFRFKKHAIVVQQDTRDDVRNCVEACLRTEVSTRNYVPEFGIDDPTFDLSPVNTDAILSQISLNERRALADIEQTVNELISRLRVGVDTVA